MIQPPIVAFGSERKKETQFTNFKRISQMVNPFDPALRRLEI
jgi:hypothetical protein